MRRVLVTGGAGYIGAMVVQELVAKGHHPVVLDNFCWGRDALCGLEDKVTVSAGDVRSSRDLIYALQDVDSVIHLAGIVGAPACDANPLAHYTTNVESVRTLVSCMTDPEVELVRDLIFCSSCSVYGNLFGMFDEVDEATTPLPLSSYAQGKLRAEQIILSKADEVRHFAPTIMRLTTIFGWARRPRLDLVTNYFVYKAVAEGEITIFGDGGQYRSLIHVRDVARALVAALEAPRSLRDRQIFHVGEEENNVTIRNVAEIVQKYLPDTRVIYKEEADTDRRDYRIACRKIKNVLNWRAEYSVEDGIRELVDAITADVAECKSDRLRNFPFDYT